MHLTDFLQVSPILFLLFLPPHFPLRYYLPHRFLRNLPLLNSPQIRLIQLLHLLLWGPFLRRESLVSSLLLGKLSLIALHWSNSKALDSHNSPEVWLVPASSSYIVDNTIEPSSNKEYTMGHSNSDSTSCCTSMRYESENPAGWKCCTFFMKIFENLKNW